MTDAQVIRLLLRMVHRAHDAIAAELQPCDSREISQHPMLRWKRDMLAIDKKQLEAIEAR